MCACLPVLNRLGPSSRLRPKDWGLLQYTIAIPSCTLNSVPELTTNKISSYFVAVSPKGICITKTISLIMPLFT